MRHNNHNSFILTSITKILEEAISATSGIGDGIETYALYDYVMQSVFLKNDRSARAKDEMYLLGIGN